MSDPQDRVAAGQSWASALVRAAVLLVLALVGFAFIPDRLIAYLSLHVAPRVRDSIISVWEIAYFVFMCRAFVVIQRRGRS